MGDNRKVMVGLLLTFMIISVPWAAADISSWAGPPQIASNGQDVEVDGWNVPSNATILDGWMTAEDKMVNDGNGSEWRVDTTTNFSSDEIPEEHLDLLEVVAGYRFSDNFALTLSYEEQIGGDMLIEMKKHVILGVRLKL